MNEYSRSYEIRFSDIDANRHVNHAVYADAAGDVRYKFFAERGFPPERFAQMGIGPVYTKLTVEFLREVLLGETVTITYALAGLSTEGTRWKVHHEVLKSNRKKAAILDVEGVILDLTTRKTAAPGPELMQVFNAIPRTASFQILPELLRRK